MRNEKRDVKFTWQSCGYVVDRCTNTGLKWDSSKFWKVARKERKKYPIKYSESRKHEFVLIKSLTQIQEGTIC